VSYDYDIGILILEGRNPFVPRDVGNASSFAFLVLYKMAIGPSSPMVRSGVDGTIDQMVIASRDFEKRGAKPITGDCGYVCSTIRISSVAR
jgi:hypothetical protein